LWIHVTAFYTHLFLVNVPLGPRGDFDECIIAAVENPSHVEGFLFHSGVFNFEDSSGQTKTRQISKGVSLCAQQNKQLLKSQ
ncbi:MAG: hypothetical protein ACOYN2_06945, partial [Patescibacteria group bacterium]